MAAPTGPKEPKPSNQYLKYSGLGLQLLVTIGLCAWLGHWLDVRLGLKFPIFLLVLTFAGLGGSMYQLYRQLMR
ncbi:MAG: AtpZ/AtpI family protein [Cyclobacteriaceae bacterium]|jgi:hypothetical protein|nr:AtpZ/AtpI family protein [Cyclobacteriaceae bacterium]